MSPHPELSPGFAFLDVASSVPHLYFVASSPDDSSEIVLLSLTTDRPHADHTCEIAVGEHPFVTRPTVVAYYKARCVTIDWLKDQLEKGFAIRREPLSPELLGRVQQGAIRSLQTPIGIKAKMRTELL